METLDGRIAILNSNLPRSSIYSAGTRVELANNVGNAYISFSMARLLGVRQFAHEVTNIWLPEPPPAFDPDRVSKVIINLQDHLSLWPTDSHYENGIRHLKAVEAKAGAVLAFSLAANTYEHTPAQLAAALSPSCLRFFKTLAALCSSIGVRGEFTAAVLEHIGITNYAVTGCPSYFEAGRSRKVQPALQRLDRHFIGVTGRLGVQSDVAVIHYLQGDEEWPIIDLMHLPSAEWRSAAAAQTLGHERFRRVAWAALDGAAHFFMDFKAWKDHIERNCIVVGGTRLHGAIVALNAGVPAVVGNGDARAKEICQFLGIPWMPRLTEHGGPSPRELMELADVSRVNLLYPQRYDAFVSWLRDNGFEAIDACASPFTTPSLPKVAQEVVSRRLLDACDEALRSAFQGASAQSWTAYTPTLMGATSGGGTSAEGRYRIEGATLFINLRLTLSGHPPAPAPLRLGLPPGARVVAPTAMGGRDVASGAALQALADEDYIAIFDIENRYPAYDGCALVVSGSCEIELAPSESAR